MTMLFTTGTVMVMASVRWLLAWARLEAQQLKRFRAAGRRSCLRIISEEQVNERQDVRA
jgi:hypothetical protein